MLTLYIADAERDADMKSLSPEEAIAILSDMKIDIPIPKAAVTQIKRNVALDMAINALICSEIPNSSDTISRQAAIDALTRKMVSIPTAGEKDLMGDVNRIRTEDISVIRRLPSAQQEIIRCKDCKYYKYSEWLLPHMSCHYLIGSTVIRESDDFCSRAERRTDG